MLKATSRVSSRSPSLPSNAYIIEKEHDYDSDATLDIDDVTPSGRPFGAPLRRMSEYGSPLNMPVQLLGSVADTPKKGLAVEVRNRGMKVSLRLKVHECAVAPLDQEN